MKIHSVVLVVQLELATAKDLYRQIQNINPPSVVEEDGVISNFFTIETLLGKCKSNDGRIQYLVK